MSNGRTLLQLARRMLTSAITIVVTVIVLLSLLLYLLQERIIYYPTRELVTTPAAINLDYEEVTIASSRGNRVHGWYLPHPAPRGHLLFFHGNGGNISHRLDSLAIFHRLGLATLIIDYQGYGQSTGKPSERATYDDALAARDFLLHEKKTDADALVYFGRSLGAAVAAWLAEQHPPRALILESTFTSVADMGKRLYPFLPVGLLTRHDYATGERIGNIHVPVLILHSPEDEIVPYDFGRQLYDLANEPKTFAELKGGHNDGFLVSGGYYLHALDRFLTDNLGNGRDLP